MKKLAVLILVSVFFLSACQSRKVDEDPQTVINKAWEKWTEENTGMTSGVFSGSGKATLKVKSDTMSLEGSLNTQYDSKDAQNPKIAVKFDLKGNGALEGKSGNVDLKAELRLLEKKLYVFLENANLDLGDPQINLVANMIGNLYKSQWVELPLGSSEAIDTLGLLHGQTNTTELAKIAKNNNFLEAKQHLGNRNYEVLVNPEKLKKYFAEINQSLKLPESSPAQNFAQNIDNVFKGLEYSLELMIGNDYDLEKVKISATAQDAGTADELNVNADVSFDKKNDNSGTFGLRLKGETPADLNVTFKSSNKKKSVSIEVPKDAKPFDLGALFGNFGGEEPAPEIKD